MEVQKKSQYILRVPEIVDCLQGILTVIPLQLLSFHIAVLKGYNVSTGYRQVKQFHIPIIYVHLHVSHPDGSCIWLASHMRGGGSRVLTTS